MLINGCEWERKNNLKTMQTIIMIHQVERSSREMRTTFSQKSFWNVKTLMTNFLFSCFVHNSIGEQ